MEDDSRLRRFRRYLWHLDRRTRRLLRMEPTALLETSHWADEDEKRLVARLSGSADREGGAGGAGEGGREGGAEVGTGGGGGSDGDGNEDGDDEDETESGLARTEKGSAFDVDMNYGARQKVGLVLGPLLFALVLLAPNPEGLSYAGQAVAGATAWVAVWWISEAAPIPATSLLPLVLFPATGAVGAEETAEPYASPIVFLFMGGFFIAVSIQRWGLHRRIALRTVSAIGTDPRFIILGFMTATAFLSMWVSNTATAVMMTPIGLAVVAQVGSMVEERGDDIPVGKGEFNFGTALMLCLAYSASVGGVGTLIGSPPNIVFAGAVREVFGQEISFLDWMLYGVPIAVLGVVGVWLYIANFLLKPRIETVPGGLDVIDDELEELGRMSREEKLVLGVFVATAVAWISREFVVNRFLPGVGDSTIAVAGALLLFLIPARDEEGEFTFLLDWTTALKIPWGIILLFGGGLSIASGFNTTGLAEWIGGLLIGLEGVPFVAVIAAVVILTIFMSEITSNTATTAMLMPVLASLAVGIAVHPYGLMIAGATAASFAFMLPVATPPNAVVFGSGYIKISQMVRVGFVLNILGIILIVVVALTWLPFAWGIDVTQIPPWAS
ncbi:MAG: DASS family sodium-coupled anion symporter [Halobacteriales archaeon]|nr:DASS family sodium-coupled anion symporter [Halobacteriales archaeon]